MPDILKILLDLRIVFITILLGLSIYYLIVFAHKTLGDDLPIKITKKKLIYSIILILFLLFLYKIISMGGIIIDIIFIIFISMILSYIINPIVNKIQKKKIKRPLAILIVYLGIFAFLAIIIMTIGPKIVDEITEFIQNLPKNIADLYAFTKRFYENNLEDINKMSKALNIESPEQIFSNTLEAAKTYATNWSIGFANGVVSFFGKAFNMVLIPIVTFYMLKDKDKIKDGILRTIPWKKRDEVVKVSKDIDDVIGAFIRGQLIVCLFIGVATAIALTIIGIDFSILIGIFAGIFNIVPYLGPIIGLIPAVIIALMDDPIKVISVVISITVIQQIESNFISPKIVGDSVGLHPIVVMVSVLLGGSYFGIFGMLLAVPTIATLRILFNFFGKKIKKMDDENIF
ncbi:MAG: AI-2E family transporter [Andreesenia angusta]|nr:AI-2E family transporter [Andreesenia angusta]